MKKKVDLSIIFCSMFISSCVISLPQCSQKSGNFTPNSTYALNRQAMLFTLPDNVTASSKGFYKTPFGQDSNISYGLGMCMPGMEAKTCSQCIEGVSTTLLSSCPNQIEAIDWGDGELICLVHYSNRPLYGWHDEDLKWEGSTNSTYTLANVTEFDMKRENFMKRVIRKNAHMSFYIARTEDRWSSPSIYAAFQCTNDLPLSDCTDCLLQFVTNRSCCHGIQGAIMWRTNCYMRWEIYQWGPFRNTTSITPLPPPRSPTRHTPPPPPPDRQTNKTKIVVIATIGVFTVLLALGFAVSRRRKVYQAFTTESGYFSFARRPRNTYAADDMMMSSGSLRFDFRAIKAATNNFQRSNKLGHGGFGAVYKGVFPNGTEVAAKRLSKTSDQGEREFKNEVLLVAMLQHKNLVRLLGFSVEGEEKILVYEFVPNKSLDYFLFDQLKRAQLDWTTRLNIIEGITLGILYLHQDSRPTVIHRDLKASNILLDADMNPKIADFGMARNFRVNQTEANTSRVVGTFGYMPPEYVANGHFSTKSDVYSFGVLILEIIGGKKNSSFHRIDGSASNLVSYVWRLWNNQSLLELVDLAIGENYDKDEVIRCIHIGLLCVQENPADRPSMSKIFQMLTNTSSTLSVPQPPGFFFRERSEQNPLAERFLPGPSTNMSYVYSVDDDTSMITIVSPR